MRNYYEQKAINISKCISEITKRTTKRVHNKRKPGAPVDEMSDEEFMEKKTDKFVANKAISKKNNKIISAVCKEFGVNEAHIRTIMKGSDDE